MLPNPLLPIPPPGVDAAAAIPVWQAILGLLSTAALSFMAALTGFQLKINNQQTATTLLSATLERELKAIREDIVRERERDRERSDRRHAENRRKLDAIIGAAADLMKVEGLDKRFADTAFRLLAELSVHGTDP